MSNEEEYAYSVKIPKERIAVLIGTKGETKKQIEKETSAKIDIDSKEGDVTITGTDSLKLYSTKDVIQAIGRGFNPELALLLMKIDYAFELVEIKDYAKSKNSMQRLRGRVIGEEGKSKKTIENLTDTHISIHGKTVGIIGKAEDVSIARQAVEQLLEGASHASVFKFLEKKRRDSKMQQFQTKTQMEE